MDPRVQSYSDPADIYGQELEEMQDAMVEHRLADGCTDAKPSTWSAPGSIKARRVGEARIGLHHECTTGGETILDDSVDWRDRYVDRAWVAGEDADSKMPGGTGYAAASTYAKQELDGYTGKGATGGAPPTLSTGQGIGEYWTPWTNFYIYVTTTGKLACYNNIGSPVYLWGVIGLTGPIGGTP